MLPAGVLSGGEQQMLTLAPVLVDPPALLVADEPSLGLAPQIVEQVFGMFKELRDKGVTLVLVEEKVRDVLPVADELISKIVERCREKVASFRQNETFSSQAVTIISMTATIVRHFSTF